MEEVFLSCWVEDLMSVAVVDGNIPLIADGVVIFFFIFQMTIVQVWA
jgi:hypothetical protein